MIRSAALTEQVRAIREQYAPRPCDNGFEDENGEWVSMPGTVRVVGHQTVNQLCDLVDALAEALAQVEKERDAFQKTLEDISSKMRCADGCDAIARAALALAAGRGG